MTLGVRGKVRHSARTKGGVKAVSISASQQELPGKGLLNLSRQCAVVRDDVVSIRINNCNMAQTVNFACADQSFVYIYLLALESDSIPPYPYAVVPCTRKPPHSEMNEFT